MSNYTQFKIQKYGWKPDKPDKRDFKFLAPTHPVALLKLPGKVDLRSKMPPIYDQGELGSCTANAVGAACHYTELNEKRATVPVVMPARLFIYFNTRVLEHTWKEDAGAEIRDTMKSVKRWGYAPEELWPYYISKFAVPPVIPAYAKAWWYKTSDYLSVAQCIVQLKSALARGYPVAFGFTVYDSFISQALAQTGIMRMPNIATERVLGGHAVLMVGYDDAKKCWIVRNSWGPNWGDHGYFYMPFEYALDPDLSSDFWIVRSTP